MPARGYIPANANLGGLVAEFDSNSRFNHPVTAGTVTYQDRTFILELSVGEVSAIKSGSFRIARLVGNAKQFLMYGTVSYIANKVEVPDHDPVTGLATVAETGDYNDLVNKPSFATPGAVDEKVAAVMQSHSASANPHTVYDDMQSLTLLFENGLI